MIAGFRVVRGVLELAARRSSMRRGTLPLMATKAKKSAKAVHGRCGAELVKGATFCWHCKAPIGAAAASKPRAKSAKKK